MSGSSLIEVLISMLVLGMGILGISALQTTALKSNQNAYMRTQAVFHSLDIVERMRGNQVAVAAGNYNDPTPMFNASCQSDTGCSSSQLAAHDVAMWESGVTTGLPLGDATVCLDSTSEDGMPAAPACDNSGSIYAVKIWWDDDRNGVADQRYVMTFQPD